jgi:hypothetical protein
MQKERYTSAFDMRFYKMGLIFFFSLSLSLLIKTTDSLTQTQNQMKNPYYDQYGMMAAKPEKSNNPSQSYYSKTSKTDKTMSKLIALWYLHRVTRRFLSPLAIFVSSSRKRAETGETFATDQHRTRSQIRRFLS